MVAISPEVEGLFSRFKELTGDAASAATLVLAHATMTARAESPAVIDGWMSCAQVALKLGVAPKTIRDLIHCGKLNSTKVGTGRGTYRVSPEDLAAFQKSAGGTAASANKPRKFKHLPL